MGCLKFSWLRLARNFARSLQEKKSRSLSLAPFLPRYRLLSLPLRGLCVSQILSYYVHANAFCHLLNKRILID